MISFDKHLPIYDIDTPLVYSDNYGAFSLCYKLELPNIYTLNSNDFEKLILAETNFLRLLGPNTFIHIQNRFYRNLFSLYSDSDKISQDAIEDFMNEAYNLHFDKRPYFNHECYIAITKVPDLSVKTNIGGYLNDNGFLKEDSNEFIQTVESALYTLKKNGVTYTLLEEEDIINEDTGLLPTFYSLSNPVTSLKDPSFADNSTYVGGKKIVFATIEKLSQFSSNWMKFSKKSKKGLPVSAFFPLSYQLPFPHFTNQYIYVPDQITFRKKYETRQKNLNSFRIGDSGNGKAADEINSFFKKMEALNALGVYYHFNVMAFDEEYNIIDQELKNAFKDLEITYNENTIDRKLLFDSAIPGNGHILAASNSLEDMMMPMIDMEALNYGIWEQNYKDQVTAVEGIKLCDLLYGIPFDVDFIEAPKKRGAIKNKGITVLSGTGGGKSFLVNLILLNELRRLGHVFIIDASYSFKINNKFHNGVYLEFDDKNKISFNPFYIRVGNEDILETKINLLIQLITAITKSDTESFTRFEETVIRQLITKYYSDRTSRENWNNYKFDDFYGFAKENLEPILAEEGITKEDFNYKTFLFSLKPFQTGESLGYLLNSEDERIKDLTDERFIVIDISKIVDNDILFSVVSLLAMDVYNNKIDKLPMGTKKFFVLDEAWQAISSPKMESFVKKQVKVVRKYGGIPVFISQEPDDFISSKVVKESIINNCDIRIFLDMSDFESKFDPIQKVMSLTDSQVSNIKAVGKNMRTNAKHREMCIAYKNGESYLYGVEAPFELQAIFETDPDEVDGILTEIDKWGVGLMAKNFADKKRNISKH